MRRMILRSLLALAAGMAAWKAPQAATVEIEGVQVEDAIVAHGNRLVLNGAGVRKRGYFKSDVVALYLPERKNSAEAVAKPTGARRLVLVLLRDIPSATITRYFIGDFKQVATDAEFKQVINEVGQMGQIYGNMSKVNKGDVVVVDWIPGQGMVGSLNGKPFTDKPWNSPLFFEIYMRMYVGSTVPAAFRDALLGKGRGEE